MVRESRAKTQRRQERNLCALAALREILSHGKAPMFQTEAMSGVSRKVLHSLLPRPGLVVAIGCVELINR
jgi:hypothetical protein